MNFESGNSKEKENALSENMHLRNDNKKALFRKGKNPIVFSEFKGLCAVAADPILRRHDKNVGYGFDYAYVFKNMRREGLSEGILFVM